MTKINYVMLRKEIKLSLYDIVPDNIIESLTQTLIEKVKSAEEGIK